MIFGGPAAHVSARPAQVANSTEATRAIHRSARHRHSIIGNVPGKESTLFYTAGDCVARVRKAAAIYLRGAWIEGLEAAPLPPAKLESPTDPTVSCMALIIGVSQQEGTAMSAS